MRPAAIAVLLLCAWLGSAQRAYAKTCAASAACGGSTYLDVVELRDGSIVCGSILYRDDGNTVIIVDAQHQNRTIPWDEIACLDQHGLNVEAPTAVAAPAPTPEPAPALVRSALPESDASSADDEESERSAWLDWDVRLAGGTFFKRYTQQDASAWSWGMGGGVAFGATLHYPIGPATDEGPINWSDLELGLSGTVTYGAWNQVSAGQAALIEQDLSLRVGARFKLGGTRSGVFAGISWLPTYVDFYGREIKAQATVQPLGVRVTLDFGDTSGSYQRDIAFRVALFFLPYFGRLPSMIGLSAGIALH